MGQPYVGEIRIFAGNFPPAGWAMCDGQLMQISENETLFNLIGTTFGGDGQVTFAMPDLRGRIPIHQGTGTGLTTRTLGESIGVETVTLTQTQIPDHTHSFQATTALATATAPTGAMLATPSSPTTGYLYLSGTASGTVNNAAPAADAVGSTGSGQPHDNLMPYLGVNYIISLFGIFPSQN